ncbi:MAG: glucokinase [Chloroflexi bacterium]|jgi:glucokinase|nr:glucokinase [Chloroflexota bacterium]
MLLAGDVGGTKTDVAIYAFERGPRQPLVEATFASAEYPSLETMVLHFLEQTGLQIDQAIFGVAGAVVNGQAQGTNLPWLMQESQLQQVLGLQAVRLINDLEAIASAVPYLKDEDRHTINTGVPVPHGTIAIIAPGTGLGEAFLGWDGTHYRAYPSEGGHADFAPSRPVEIGLLKYLMDQFGHVSVERVCSGKGIPNIYAYLRESGRLDEPDWLRDQLAAADDPTPIIVNTALTRPAESALCVATLDTFVSILGAEAGNLALKVLATGGVYLGGGIPLRILHSFEQPRFLDAFRSKGRLEHLMRDMPIHIITNPKVGLMGAAYRGMDLWG